LASNPEALILRIIKTKTTKSILFIILIFASLPGYSSNKATENELSFDKWIDRIRTQAFLKGISSPTLDSVFQNTQQIPDVIQSTQQNQKKNNSFEFFLNDDIIFNSKNKLNKYSDILFEIQHLFGVDREVIIAVAAIVNQQASRQVHYPAIDVLSNLSYIHPRNQRFQQEIIQALKIVDEGQANSNQLKSNHSGMLGQVQFKPSVFREFAVDFDGDGKYDIWHNQSDILASIANYLTSVGWQNEQNWGWEISLPIDFDYSMITLNHQKSINQWQARGVRKFDGSNLEFSTNMSTIIETNLNGEKKWYLVFENYFTLLRWNRSDSFALTVCLLLDKLKPKIESSDEPMASFPNP